MGKGKSREIIEEKIQMINTCGEMLKQQWDIMLHWLEQQTGKKLDNAKLTAVSGSKISSAPETDSFIYTFGIKEGK